MPGPSESQEKRRRLRQKVLGFGETSHQKSYYPTLRRRLRELERLRLLLDHSTDAIFWVEVPSGRIVDLNATARNFLHIAAGEENKVILGDIFPNTAAGLIRNLFAGSSSLEGVDRTVEAIMSSPSGERIPVEMNIGFHQEDNAVYAMIVARNITGRKRVEDALRRSEERLKLALEAANDGMWDFYPQTGVIYYSPRWFSILGYSPDDLPHTYRTWTSLIHPDDRPFVEEQIWESIQNAEPFVLEYRMRSAEGDWLWILSRGKCVAWDEEGHPTRMVGTHSDITERKEVEQTLRQLATVVEQAAEDIIIVNTEGIIAYVNPAFERITGYTREEAVGQTPAFLKSGKHDRAFYQDLWDTIIRGDVWTGRIINRRKDGSLIEEDTTISPVYDRQGRITAYVSLKRDVTDQVQMEVQLRQAQKMEAVGQLAGGVAHDFNNLLQVIQGYGDMALMYLQAGDRVRRYVEEIMKATGRASTLVRQLLTFSRRELFQPENLNFNDVIADLIKMLRRVIGEHIELEFHPAADLRMVYADRGQVEQIVMNLCVNSRDAMPEGGRITIETGSVRFTGENIHLHPRADEGEYVFVSVSDTGIGIPPEVQDRIFEPFFTTKEIGAGTGLGLATVYAITRRHEGFIDLESRPGSGAAFRIFFPADHGTVHRPENPKPFTPNEGKGTILVAEDEEQVRELAVMILEKAGYEVIAAGDGQEAIDLFNQHMGRIDLVLLDVVMPRKSGKAAFEAMKEKRPDVRVLFSTGYSFNTLNLNDASGGRVQMISKPYSPSELLRRVQTMLKTEPDRSASSPAR